jgi:biopolymer transport protein ExbB
MYPARITVALTFASVLTAALIAPAAAQPAAPQPAAPQKKAAPKSERLVDAYKREFAFLESEKAALGKRLAEDKRAAQSRLAAARGELSTLQSQVVVAAGEAERIEELLLDAERKLDAVEQSEDVGEELLGRAQVAYSRVGLKLPEAAADGAAADGAAAEAARQLAQLGFIFEQAPAALGQLSTVRVAPGAYFDTGGVKVEGSILHLGGIASYGLVDGAMGPLAPAGEERLKLWPVDGGAEAAAALRDGKPPATLPLFLYESLDKGAEPKAVKTLEQFMEAGGAVGWVIVGLGVITLLMALGRTALLTWASRGGRRLLQPVLDAISRGDLAQARRLAASERTPSGRVLTATITNLGKSREQVEDVVAEAVLHEQPHLARFGAAILVLAAVAPLLGLLGTVTGMISTFDIITEFGTGNPKLLSGGISEALVTTELGLIVAIPALLLGHILNGWSEKIRDGLDAAALATVNRAVGLEPPADAPGHRADAAPPSGRAPRDDGEVAA